MLTHLITSLTVFIMQVISTLGYGGVALLMAIESACIPLPSEIIAPFAGYLVFTGRFNLFVVALAGGVGSMLGSWAIYEIGKFGGRPLVEKYGKWILISHHDIKISDRLFEKYGNLSTFIGRLLPVVRTFISLPAGIARVPKIPFLVYSFIGSTLWTFVLAYFGMKLGENWSSLKDRFHNFDLIIGVIIIVGIIWWVWRHVKHRKLT